MKLPGFSNVNKNVTDISVFRGINRGINTGFSRVSQSNPSSYTEFADMRNLSSDDFPQLGVRKKRSCLSHSLSIKSNLLFSDGRLIYIDGSGKLVFNGSVYEHSAIQAGRDHSLTLYGNRVVIMPEKLVFELSTLEFGEIESISENEATHIVSGDAMMIPNRYNDNGFTIEKVSLDESGHPYPSKLVLEMAAELDNGHAQESGTVEDTRQDWHAVYYHAWGWVEIGDTVEAMGEGPSGLYRCYSIGDGTQERNKNKPYHYPANVKRDFVKIENYYVRLWVSTTGLKVGDYVTISGMTDSTATPSTFIPPGRDPAETVLDGWGNYLEVLNNQTFKVFYVDESSIVIKANLQRSVPYTGSIAVSRVMPAVDGDKMLEVNNRLWACGSEHNEIYACKQGDPTNWMAFGDAISTDSFAMTVGCEGAFTGIARQNDSVIFFKENWILKVYGTKPSNYTLATYNAPGVEKGSSKSLVWVNGVLYYLSPRGVCQYAPGALPVIISEDAFGGMKFKDGTGGRHGDKYYLSAKNENGDYELFVYDTVRQMWHREDETQFKSTATYNDRLYYIDENGGKLTCVEAKDNLFEIELKETEVYFNWFAETGDLYDKVFGTKYISRLDVGLKCERGATVRILAKFRAGGEWVKLREIDFENEEPVVIPIAVRRSDFLRMRIEGRCKCNIYGMSIEYSIGSDRRPWRF